MRPKTCVVGEAGVRYCARVEREGGKGEGDARSSWRHWRATAPVHRLRRASSSSSTGLRGCSRSGPARGRARVRRRRDGPGERKAQAPTMLTWHSGERYQLRFSPPCVSTAGAPASRGNFSSSEDGVRSREVGEVDMATAAGRAGGDREVLQREKDAGERPSSRQGRLASSTRRDGAKHARRRASTNARERLNRRPSRACWSTAGRASRSHRRRCGEAGEREGARPHRSVNFLVLLRHARKHRLLHEHLSQLAVTSCRARRPARSAPARSCGSPAPARLHLVGLRTLGRHTAAQRARRVQLVLAQSSAAPAEHAAPRLLSLNPLVAPSTASRPPPPRPFCHGRSSAVLALRD